MIAVQLFLLLAVVHPLVTSCCYGQANFPLRVSEGGLILLEAAANDTVKGNFILDTGAGVHVMSNAFMRRLRSVPAGRFTGFRHTGERVDFPLFRVKSLSIGPLKEEQPFVASWSVLDSFNIDGIISAMIFKRQPVTFDLLHRSIVPESDKSLARRLMKGRKIPLKVIENREKSIDLFADFIVSGTLVIECIIDTGSPETVVDARFAPSLNVDLNAKGVEKKERKSLFGSVEQEWRTVLPRLALASLPGSDSFNKKMAFKNNLIYDGLVGNDFWIGRIVTINIPERYLIVGE